MTPLYAIKKFPALSPVAAVLAAFALSATFSLAHGGNDAQKTAGIIWLLLIAATTSNVQGLPVWMMATTEHLPIWVVIVCYIAIGFGTMNLMQTLEQEEISRLNKTIPAYAPGDTVIVSVNVVEGNRKRVQAFEGVVIAKRNRGLNSSFIVRKISNGEGVERTFQVYSPLIAKIEVKRRGDVRRAKLYYLRSRSGKSARIKEKLGAKAA